jgi:RNA polymerase sigma-70 factor (ECF subfamily)
MRAYVNGMGFGASGIALVEAGQSISGVTRPGWKNSTERRLDENQASALLVRRCVAGETAAWEEIVRLHNRRIYNLCYRFAGSADDAQDLTQEVFIKIYRTLSSFDGTKASFVTWVTTVTRNLLVDHFRKGKYDRMTDSLDAPIGDEEDGLAIGAQIQDKGQTPDQRLESRETKELVHRALQKLSPELREAVILRDLQDMDYKEISQVLKIPEGTVKSRINRGRTELARLLQRSNRQVGD